MAANEPLHRIVPARDSGVRLDIFLAGQKEIANRSQALLKPMLPAMLCRTQATHAANICSTVHHNTR